MGGGRRAVEKNIMQSSIMLRRIICPHGAAPIYRSCHLPPTEVAAIASTSRFIRLQILSILLFYCASRRPWWPTRLRGDPDDTATSGGKCGDAPGSSDGDGPDPREGWRVRGRGSRRLSPSRNPSRSNSRGGKIGAEAFWQRSLHSRSRAEVPGRRLLEQLAVSGRSGSASSPSQELADLPVLTNAAAAGSSWPRRRVILSEKRRNLEEDRDALAQGRASRGEHTGRGRAIRRALATPHPPRSRRSPRPAAEDQRVEEGSSGPARAGGFRGRSPRSRPSRRRRSGRRGSRGRGAALGRRRGRRCGRPWPSPSRSEAAAFVAQALDELQPAHLLQPGEADVRVAPQAEAGPGGAHPGHGLRSRRPGWPRSAGRGRRCRRPRRSGPCRAARCGAVNGVKRSETASRS